MSPGQDFNAPSGFDSTDAPNGTTQFNARSKVARSTGSFFAGIGMGTVPNTIQTLQTPNNREQGHPRSETHPALQAPSQTQVSLLCYGPSAGVPALYWEEAKLFFQWAKRTFVDSFNGALGFTVVAAADSGAVVHGSGLDAAFTGVSGAENFGFFEAATINPIADAAVTLAGGFGGSFRDHYDVSGAGTAPGGSVFVNSLGGDGLNNHLSHMVGAYGPRQGASVGTSVNTGAWVGGEGGFAGPSPNPHMVAAAKLNATLGDQGNKVFSAPDIWDQVEPDALPTGVAASSSTPGMAEVTWGGGTLLTPIGSAMFGIHWSTDADRARHGVGNRAFRTGATSFERHFFPSPAVIEGLPPGKQVYIGVSVDRYIRPEINGTGVGSGNLDNTVTCFPTDPRSAQVLLTVMSSP